MKLIFAFLLLLLAPNFVSNTSFAATNSARIVSNSTILPQKQLNVKEKLSFKGLKKEGKKISTFLLFLLIGLLLIIVGLILLAIGNEKSRTYHYFSGFTEQILSRVAFLLGAISLIVSLIILITRLKSSRQL
jgi:predicted ferric reductase